MMPSYTTTTFADYLHASLSHTAAALSWISPTDYGEMITDALLMLGMTDVSEAVTPLQIRMLRMAGQVAMWQAVCAAFVGEYDFDADGGRYDRDQLYQHAMKQFETVRGQARAMGIDVDGDGGSAWAITSGSVSYDDPYGCDEGGC